MKNSYITITDQFCGAGGSSQGVRNYANRIGGGVEVKMALNHWDLAIETHSTNFPETGHDCTDISACDPRRYPTTDGLITSPECTTHSPAGGNRHKSVKLQLDLYEKGKIDPATERSRATMWDVCRFAEYHQYNFIIVENVVEAKLRWALFDVWLKAMHTLGYKHKCCYLNSMHFWPTPQSRDRMYIVFWKAGNKAPDLNWMPLARCPCCGKDIRAIQHWKNSEKKYGKYRSQYVYVCPADGTVVEPYYYAAFNAIDWSDLGTKIGERSRPLKPNTMKRIKYGLEKYGEDPLIINTRHTSGLECRVKSSIELPIGTQCTDLSHGIATPIVIKGEHTSLNGYVKPVGGHFQTQTVRQSMSLVTPWIIEMNKTGECKHASHSASTITSGGVNHAILGSPLVVENKGQSKSKPTSKPFGALTTMINHGIVSDDALKSFLSYYNGSSQASGVNEAMGTVPTHDRVSVISYQKPKIEDCYYRMLKAHEVQRAMAFDDNYVIVGNSRQKVKQCGNAVTPPAMEWPVGQCVESLK
ncbi:DNA cytosine methyltransferase [Echinicola strongylocentroti]|uniref:DNA (cytosine-5-)-methyltransferase n=1 Tax=Echinicola strongylocentroti TaxID=1795355 RepID=A0A2Z4INA8_9BACT|nr:DNA cytosine methyltransferase [Echinicola strongylocentroti]AWW31863.1 DNA cytosine methyltransferase [Echinicola strongylocentroti]